MITNISDTSIEAFLAVQAESAFHRDLDLVAVIAKELGQPTVDEVRQHILAKYPAIKGKDEVGARMADAWRIHGSVRQTGATRVSRFSGKKGNVWEWVDEDNRAGAKRQYWEQRRRNLDIAYAKACLKLEKEMQVQ